MNKKPKFVVKDFFNKAASYLIWFLILLLVIPLVRNITKAGKVKADLENERARVEKIRQENEELEAKIAETKSDFFIEREIRNKLGLAKEGEYVVVLPDEETLRSLAPKISEEENTLPDSNWKKWLKLFI